MFFICRCRQVFFVFFDATGLSMLIQCVTQELGSLLVGNNNKFTVAQRRLKGDRLDSNCKIVRCFDFSRFVCFHQMKITWKPDITGSHFVATGSNAQPRSWGARGSGFAESRRELQLAHVGALGSEDARHTQLGKEPEKNQLGMVNL